MGVRTAAAQAMDKVTAPRRVITEIGRIRPVLSVGVRGVMASGRRGALELATYGVRGVGA